MSYEALNSLLKEYEQKKLKAELDLEERKKELYEKIPRLQQLEDDLNKFALSVSKNILLNNDNSNIKDLNEKIEKLKFEKACILQDMNLPYNYLKPNYECSICNDTGYISKNGYSTEMCSCLKQRLLDISFNKSNMANLNKENFETFNSKVFSDEIDVSKYRFNISPRTNIENIKNKCIEFVKNFDNPDYKNLLFSGNTGLR